MTTGKLITNASLWLLAGVAPTATTAASAVTSSTATLNATVNPNGQATTASFQYGATTSYGNTTSTQNLAAGTSGVQVSANLSGLNANATYHFRVVAANATGTSYGADQTFQTPVPPPMGTTTAAGSVASSQATLNASVNPEGIATTYHFDFGTSTSYGWTSPESSAGSGTSAMTVALPVNGLMPGTTYHYRIIITSTSGTVNGMDTTFTTPAFVDSDGDGIPDDYETTHGLNPRDATDALLDADGDGQSNLAEYLAGTDPADATDSFRVLGATVAGTNVAVSFTTVFGKRYLVERTASLSAPTWTAIGSITNGNGTPLTLTDTGAAASGAIAFFYRARIVP